MNQRPTERTTSQTMTPAQQQDEMRRGPEPPPTQSELESMNRTAGAMSAPTATESGAREQPRTGGALSTADVAAAMDRKSGAGTGPKYVEGEEATAGAGRATPLFPENEVQGFRSRWQEVQTGFVDEPRRSVEQADHLVAEVMKRLAEGFAQERGKLEQQWGRGDNINTEDLRVALQRYRSFFERLLSA